LLLGQLFLQGGYGIQQDFREAFRHLEIAAQAGSPQAMGYIGFLYLEGEGVEKDEIKAVQYFEYGASREDASSLNGLGLAHLYGISVPKNQNLARAYFEKAAEKGNSDAQVNLALMTYNGVVVPKNPQVALKLFLSASQQGHVLAQYYLGLMHLHGIGLIGGKPSCPVGVALLKMVAERNQQASIIEEAHNDYKNQRYHTAILKYLCAAEQGYDTAQLNAAYLLENVESPFNKTETEFSALLNWMRAANQGYLEAKLKVGDYYYYGLGVESDMTKAVNYYLLAEQMSSAQAMFNLGYMYENGQGLPKDLHLAKRYYDKAIQTQEDARLPVTLALVVLFIKLLLAGELNQYLGWDAFFTFFGFNPLPAAVPSPTHGSSNAGGGSGSGAGSGGSQGSAVHWEFTLNFDDFDYEQWEGYILFMSSLLVLALLVYRQLRYQQLQQAQQQLQQ